MDFWGDKIISYFPQRTGVVIFVWINIILETLDFFDILRIINFKECVGGDVHGKNFRCCPIYF